ncbi:MAG: hypothetical protein AAF417_15040 [Pseudomonadota bacterium]
MPREYTELTDEERDRGIDTGQWPEDFDPKSLEDNEDITIDGNDLQPKADPEPQPKETDNEEDDENKSGEGEDATPAQDDKAGEGEGESAEGEDENGESSDADGGETVPERNLQLEHHQNQAFASQRVALRNAEAENAKLRKEIADRDSAAAETATKQRTATLRTALEAAGATGVVDDTGAINEDALMALEGDALTKATYLVGQYQRQQEPASSAASTISEEAPLSSRYTEDEEKLSLEALGQVPEMNDAFERWQLIASDPSASLSVRNDAKRQQRAMVKAIHEAEDKAGVDSFKDIDTVVGRYREMASKFGLNASVMAPQAKEEPRSDAPTSLKGGRTASPPRSPIDAVVESYEEGFKSGDYEKAHTEAKALMRKFQADGNDTEMKKLAEALGQEVADFL